MNEKDFVHLHLHTDFSLLDGAIQIKPLSQRAQEIGARAVAVTDHGNMYGAISFYNQMKGSGIKPIIGMEAYIAKGKHTDRGEEGAERGMNHIILLAKNLQGYRNLVKLSSLAFTKGYYYKPRIDKELLSRHSEGIVALSACLSGVPSSLLLTDKFNEAARQAMEFEDILGKGNYYLEVQNHGLEEETGVVIPGMRELSKKTGIPLAATNDCHYLMREDWRAHDILVCIGAGKTVNEKRGLKYKEGEFYVRSAKEMWLIFGKDMPEALLNTVAIAEMCELELPSGENHLPNFRVPEGETIESYFAKMARAGLEERWAAIKDRVDRKCDLDDYKARLEQEITVIAKMGFAGYFLIVWDFIRYAKKNNIPVGPGRGCLEGSVPIVMEDGTTKPISQVKIGDTVRSHTGRALGVTALHRYDIDEMLVRLKCFYGDSDGVTLTKDHKVLAERGARPEKWLRDIADSTRAATRRWEEPKGDLSWIKAGDLEPGDWVFVPTPVVDVIKPSVIDLAQTVAPSSVRVDEFYIEEARPTNTSFDYSLRDVSRHTRVSRNSVRFIAHHQIPIKSSPRHDLAVARVRNYVEPQFGNLETWRGWVSGQAHKITRIARFIHPDSRFYRVLGRWVADGWLRSDSDLVLGLCFHSEDKKGLEEATDFFESLGLEPHIRQAANGRRLTQMTVRSRALVAYWRSIFPRYSSTPETKHMPDFVLRIPVENALDVLAGYWSGDGSVGSSQQSKYTATTVSRTLADQVRFLAWRCGIPASLRRDEREDERFNVQPSYVITLAKDERLAQRLDAFPKAAQYAWRAVKGGLLLRIRGTEEVCGVKEVFDLTVEEDHTYQTSSFAVHNSAAGSIVAYSLKITDIDPLQYDLLFERFLNPDRVSMPDIDIDFCVRGRQQVIDYVADYYGRDHVSQISTFGTMASKAAIKDVGRALEMPYAEVDKIAKMIPPPVRGRNVSIKDAIEQNPDLKKAIDTDQRVREVIEIAKRLEGCSRHSSVHAAGVVISPRPLDELVPVSKTARDEITTQYPMTDLEKTGMLKMDFLALTTLTIIADCLKSIERETGHQIDLAKIPLDDRAALQLFADGKTTAIFQFEGDGMRDICRRLKPEGLEDLSALNALYRPGPIDSGMVDDFIERRHGRKKVRYDFPELKEVMGNTLGICVAGDTLIFDAVSGRRLRIDELAGEAGKFFIQGVDKELKPQIARVSNFVCNGVREIVELKLRNGAQVKLTPDHKVLTENGWREVKELKQGDFIATPRGIMVAEEKEYDLRRLRVIAYLLADGSLTSTPCNADFVSKDAALIKEYVACLDAFERVKSRTLQQVRGVTRVMAAGVNKTHYHETNSLVAMLRELGLKSKRGGCRSDEKYVPEFIFGLTRKCIAFFLASLWDCDGHIGERLCHYKTISGQLAQDVQTLLLRLGIHSTIYESHYHSERREKDTTAYQVTVYNLQAFSDSIAPYLVSKAMCGSDFTGIETKDTVSRKIFVDELSQAWNGTTRDLMQRYGIDRQHILPRGKRKPRISVSVVSNITSLLSLPRTRQNLNVRWEEIKEIRPAREEKVYDITVEEIHNFVGNNIILHNCVYQEQLMAVFQKLAGYSLGEADLVRRAMGKKKREELDKHKEKFLKQATVNGHDRQKLEKLWHSFEGFADYAFNRAHSFSYGYLAYQTAYLKAHYPTHFWAAVLSNELNNTAKVVKYINEARAQGIEILPPDVNASLDNFTASGNAIRFGLAAIKGIGQSAVASITEARNATGAFRSLFDFTERVDARAAGKRVLESLIRAGAFDSLGQPRARLFAAIDSAIESGQRTQRSRASGQTDLFGSLASSMPVAEPRLPYVEDWSNQELLKGEKETLGFYISGHPLMRYDQALADFANADIDRLQKLHHGAQVTIGGIVMELNVRTTKKGDRFGLFHLEDRFGSVKVVAWPDVFGKATGIIQGDAAVLVRGRLEIDDGGSMTVISDDIQSLENIRERAARNIVVHVNGNSIDDEKVDRLHALLDSHRGDCNVVFEVDLPNGMMVRVQPNQFVRVKVTPELTNSIKDILGNCRVELVVERASSAAS